MLEATPVGPGHEREWTTRLRTVTGTGIAMFVVGRVPKSGQRSSRIGTGNWIPSERDTVLQTARDVASVVVIVAATLQTAVTVIGPGPARERTIGVTIVPRKS